MGELLTWCAPLLLGVCAAEWAATPTEFSSVVAGSQVRGSLPRWKLETLIFDAVGVRACWSSACVPRIENVYVSDVGLVNQSLIAFRVSFWVIFGANHTVNAVPFMAPLLR